MKTLEIKGTITYDDTIMYADIEVLEWFLGILTGNGLNIHENEEIGDFIASIKIEEIK